MKSFLSKMIQTNLAVVLAIGLMAPLQSRADEAGMTDSFWFEPGLACTAGAAAGYASSKKGDELTYSGVGCLVGGGLMYLVNSYYDNKVFKNKDREIQKLRDVIKLHEQIQAQKAAKGDPNEVYSLRVQETVPAQVLQDGSVVAPSIKEKLILPNQNLEVGY